MRLGKMAQYDHGHLRHLQLPGGQKAGMTCDDVAIWSTKIDWSSQTLESRQKVGLLDDAMRPRVGGAWSQPFDRPPFDLDIDIH